MSYLFPLLAAALVCVLSVPAYAGVVTALFVVYLWLLLVTKRKLNEINNTILIPRGMRIQHPVRCSRAEVCLTSRFVFIANEVQMDIFDCKFEMQSDEESAVPIDTSMV